MPLLLSAGQQSIVISCPPGPQQRRANGNRQTDACQLHRFCSAYYAASANNSAVVTEASVEESDVLPDLSSLFSGSETILGDIPSTSAELKDTQEQVSSKCVQKKLLLFVITGMTICVSDPLCEVEPDDLENSLLHG